MLKGITNKTNMKRRVWVNAGKHGWVDFDLVEFLDVGEDQFGRDEFTFKYEGEEYKSIGVVGSRPG